MSPDAVFRYRWDYDSIPERESQSHIGVAPGAYAEIPDSCFLSKDMVVIVPNYDKIKKNTARRSPLAGLGVWNQKSRGQARKEGKDDRTEI